MGVRGELFSTRVILPNRTYFFNVKENRLGDLYLNIVESKNRDEGGFDRQSVILFADDLQEFLKGFDESLKVMEKAVREQRRGGERRPAEGRESRSREDRESRNREGPKRGEGPDRGEHARRGYRRKETGPEKPRPEKYRSEKPRSEKIRQDRGPKGGGRRVVVKKNRDE